MRIVDHEFFNPADRTVGEERGMGEAEEISAELASQTGHQNARIVIVDQRPERSVEIAALGAERRRERRCQLEESCVSGAAAGRTRTPPAVIGTTVASLISEAGRWPRQAGVFGRDGL